MEVVNHVHEATKACTVLLVDDDDDVRETMGFALELDGHNVVMAVNGRDAIERLRAMTLPPCLIISDLDMPVMDGWSLHRKLCDEPRFVDVPIVVISGSLLPAPPGVEAALVKPVSPSLLYLLLHRHRRCVG